MTFAAPPFSPPIAANVNTPGDFHDHHTETDAWLRSYEPRAPDRDCSAGGIVCSERQAVVFHEPRAGLVRRSQGWRGKPGWRPARIGLMARRYLPSGWVFEIAALFAALAWIAELVQP